MDFAHTQRGDQAEVGRPQPVACGEDDLPLLQVLSCVAYVLAPFDGCVEGDGVVGNGHVFLHEYGITARRQYRTGHDADTFAARNVACVGLACEGGACHAQRALPAGGRIVCVQRVAVHGRVVVVGNIVR